MKYLLIFLVLYNTTTLFSQVTPGELDVNFNNSGIYDMTVDTDANGISCVAQPDGKIVVAGTIDVHGTQKYCIRRIDQSGTMDFSHVFAGSTGEQATVVKTLLQPDGKILVTGQLYKSLSDLSSETWFYVLRLNSDGSIDGGYGNGGRADFSLSPGKVDQVYDMVLLNDNKLVVLSYEVQYISQPNGALTILTLDENGHNESSFGTNGMVQTTHNHRLNYIPKYYRCTRTIDNRIVIGASVDRGMSAGYDYMLQRYMPNGDLDQTFGDSGTQYYPVSLGNDYLGDLSIQPDQKLLLLGKSEIKKVSNYDLVLMRLEYDGSQDTTFGDMGIVWDNYDGDTDNETPVFVDVNANSKINVVAWVSTPTAGGIAVYQFTEEGVLDSAFAEIGKTWHTREHPFYPSAADGSIFPDNKIVAFGSLMEVIDNGASSKSHFLITQWVGEEIEVQNIEENSKNKTLLFPNPSENRLNIETNTNGINSYVICNSLGEQLITNTITNQKNIEIDISDLKQGLYYVILTNEQKEIFPKLTFVKN